MDASVRFVGIARSITGDVKDKMRGENLADIKVWARELESKDPLEISIEDQSTGKYFFYTLKDGELYQ